MATPAGFRGYGGLGGQGPAYGGGPLDDSDSKCGTDDDGYAVRLKFKYFVDYAFGEAATDDSPLYVFDGSFGDKEGLKPLAKDYFPPHFAAEDLFQARRRRAPF